MRRFWSAFFFSIFVFSVSGLALAQDEPLSGGFSNGAGSGNGFVEDTVVADEEEPEVDTAADAEAASDDEA
ncbi:MAG: hypothetical protein AAFR71_15395, partial [Pseudomonadota bacterium]